MNRRGLSSVFAVAGNRMAHIGHVHAYLVFTAGVEFNFKERLAAAALKHLVAGDRKLPFLGIFGRVHLVARVLYEIAFDRALILLYVAVNHAYILTVKHHVIPIMLHLHLCFLCLSEHHEAGGVLVKAMHDENFLPRVDPLHVFLKYRVGGSGLDAVITHRQEAVTLVDNDDIVIFIDYLKATVSELWKLAGEVYLHGVAGSHRVVELGRYRAVELHLIMLEKLFDVCTLALGHRLDEKREKRSLSLGFICFNDIGSEATALGSWFLFESHGCSIDLEVTDLINNLYSR